MHVRRIYNLAKLSAVNVWDVVETRQALIQICVVGRDEIEDAAIVSYNVLKKHLRFPTHRQAKVFVEFGKPLPIRFD